MGLPEITLAIKSYDRHLALLAKRVQVPGIKLKVVEVKSEDRFHERMLLERPWDVSELSLSSYIMAKSKGLPFTAIPIFPRRLFTHSQLYVRSGSEIESPSELVGRRVGLYGGYAQSLTVWVKGDLQHEWGVGLDQVTWVSADEKTGTNFKPPSNVKLENTKDNLEELLLAGDIDVLVSSMTPQPVVKKSNKIRYLFSDPQSEEVSYFRNHGIYPIMHVIAAKSEVLTKNPGIARGLFSAFEESKELAYRYYQEDPVWSLVAGLPMVLQKQRQIMGEENGWPNGLRANREYLNRFMQCQLDQGLIDHIMPTETLFAEETSST